MDRMSATPSLGAAGLAWFRDLVRREGLFRGLGSAAVSGWKLALDYLPSRRRLRYGDIDYDFDHRVNTTWAAPTLPMRLREIFTRGKYQPSEPELFHTILCALQVNFERFTFIDLGSGKGRTLLMASDYPFRKVVGAEIIPELHEIAVQNLARYESEQQKCFALEAWLGDAREFPLPPEPMVLYLFNPFPADILRDVLLRLQQSLGEIPRETYVIYHNLIHEDVFQSMGFLRAVHRTEQYAIYVAGTN
jgi:SAM-dependent methyltransferase